MNPTRHALHGMRVLDASQQLPGPYATLLLAALGAEVTKIEPPGGDAARHLDPEMFDNVNVGKHQVTLNLKQETDRDDLYTLVRDTDVFVEGFRPGVAARLGCDYARLRDINPDLIYCSISGMGQEGPLARHPTHDLSLQAMAGALRGIESLDRVGVPWVDLATGTSAALSITAAWHAGQGSYLDMSMLDAAVAWSRVKPSGVTGDGEPTYGILSTRDGKRVYIALLEDAMWRRLCDALGWHDWRDEPSLARHLDRRDHSTRVRRRLEHDIAQLNLDEVIALATEYDLPLGPADNSGDPDSTAQRETRLPPGTPSWRGCVPLPESLVTEHLDAAE